MNHNYYNTFITVSRDCPAERGMVPPDKKNGQTKPSIEFELAADHPYTYTQEQLLYEVYVRHQGIPEAERGSALFEAFHEKPKPCLRASMLPKKYGWGIHFNAEGKLALYPVESPEYRAFADGEYKDVQLVPAMANSKK
ncbi:DUF6157 family protein [Cohnella nanjingensis]|uniref:Uncharacterized protein n=1 Tax=Cohnella nanjingensis TaxID=1387779 RepID=A0A7X0RQ50_9BACL|nr:DUF6157 family protein [Cohnella nanjingensis]MBB6670441.1 hypothetical protein [Cohnella nanjingensis]